MVVFSSVSFPPISVADTLCFGLMIRAHASVHNELGGRTRYESSAMQDRATVFTSSKAVLLPNHRSATGDTRMGRLRGLRVPAPGYGQLAPAEASPSQQNSHALEERVADLEREIAELKAIVKQLQPAAATAAPAPVLEERPAPKPLSELRLWYHPHSSPKTETRSIFFAIRRSI